MSRTERCHDRPSKDNHTQLQTPHDTHVNQLIDPDGQYSGDMEGTTTPADTRRQKVLATLAQEPSITYAMQTDIEAEPDAVILAVAIRDIGTCELRIPRD
jgi:hypothetical protein